MLTVTLTSKPGGWGRPVWAVTLSANGEALHVEGNMGRAHAGAYRKGAEAAAMGRSKRNPYADEFGHGLGLLGRRGFRNAWDDGYGAAQAAMRQERPPC